MKFFLILHIAVLLAGIGKKRLRFRESIVVTLKILFYTALPLGLILTQRDLGRALMSLFAVFTLIFASSISKKMSALQSTLGLSGSGALVYIYFNHNELFSRFIDEYL